MSGTGEKTMEEKERFAQWLECVDSESAEDLKAVRDDAGEIKDRFYKDLEFGTGGLRGMLGCGTNRMNIYVVRRATRGLAAYILKKGLSRSVAVSFDSRINSRLFAEETARTLSSYGIEAWLYPRLEPTPALSWAVRELGCGGGVMITASHNPAEYNGYKVYGRDGCQITNEAAKSILSEINAMGYFDPLPAIDESLIHQIPETVLDRFIETELSLLPDQIDGLRVVYSPLNGTGLECVKRALAGAGVKELIVVPEQEKPDGRFPTCPRPNPEERAAMELGLKLCAAYRPDLLIATDPDCDRVGIAVPDGDGYRLLNGNEVGILLFDYICKTKKESGTLPHDPVAVTTVVSTYMADAVAANYGVELRRTLTGFKYIGEQIGELEKSGESDRFIFGFEESYGYLTGTHVRDKDAVNASLMICGMAAYYKRMGKGIAQALDELKEKYGYHAEKLMSVQYGGASGATKMAAIMGKLRDVPPEEIGRERVSAVVDYNCPEMTGLPASNVLEFQLEDGSRVTVRPSGTEPKIKVYVLAHGRTEEECNGRVHALAEAAEKLLA